MTKTVFKNVSRSQLELIIANATKALNDKRNFKSFEFSIYTDGDESSIEIIKGTR